VPYGAFIVPGLVMLTLLTQSIANASFAHLLPALHRHDLRAALGAGIASWEAVIAYVARGGDEVGDPRASSSWPPPSLFVPLKLAHPHLDARSSWSSRPRPSACSASSSASGLTASRSCSSIPLLVVTPLTFLGGTFYSIDMLPPFWRAVTLVNPVVYLISGFRWSFTGTADVGIGVSLAMIAGLPRRLPRRRSPGSSRPATA
jgi:ABC-2 type transport system permease protein